MHEEDYTVSKVKLSTWKKILKLLVNNKSRFIILIITSIFLGVLDIVNSQLIRWALEDFVGSSTISNMFYLFCALSLLFSFTFGFCVFLFIKKAGEIEAYTSYELRRQSFESLQRQSFSYYDKTHHGWLMARMTSDSRKLSNILSWGLLEIIWTISLSIFVIIVLFITDWRLACIFLVVIPLMALISFLFQKQVLKHNRISRSYNSKSTAKYNESFMGAKTTKSLVIENDNLNEYSDIANNLKKSTIKAVIASQMMVSVLLFICYFVIGILYILGTKMVVEGLAVYTKIYLFITYTSLLFEPMMQLSRSIAAIQQAQASAERVVSLIESKPSLIDTPEVIEEYGDLLNDKEENWPKIKGDIEFKNVTYYYNENEVILKDFNLSIKAGSSVALVGHTGSGKTTLVNLISRFYEPVSGEILIDGVDYRKRSIHYLHKQLGYVLQNPQLFSTTILENIRYGNLKATDEECINAARLIGASEFIEKLELKYDTLVGESGNLLSVGEKQLISFARAIIADPQLLILDEATSSIDSEAEGIIQEATKKILANRTSIVVAHRLSTIINSDLIVMLRDGEIIESGTHKELLALRGEYFKLYKDQFFEQNTTLLENQIL